MFMNKSVELMKFFLRSWILNTANAFRNIIIDSSDLQMGFSCVKVGMGVD